MTDANRYAAGLAGARRHGAAAACGLARGVRRDPACGAYRPLAAGAAPGPSGDVYARAFVGRQEIRESAARIRAALDALDALAISDGDIRHGKPGSWPRPLRPESLSVSLIEGWRGEICHAALTDATGRVVRYKMTDPSFHNWEGLAMALRSLAISDFPLCNKSFNLSYCGHDL